MKTAFIWLGVLAGSVGLGVGMYTVVVAPGTSGMTVSGTTAAPEPRPTVVQYKTKIVKDPPEKKIVDVPVAAAGSGQPASSGGRSAYTPAGQPEERDDERIVYNEPENDEGESEGNEAAQERQEAAEEQREYEQEAAEEQREYEQEAAEEQREYEQQAAEEQREAAKDASEDREEEDDD